MQRQITQNPGDATPLADNRGVSVGNYLVEFQCGKKNKKTLIL